MITATHWRLVAPDGDVGQVQATAKKGDPRTQLRVLLTRVQSAFPDERGLVIVARPDAPYASIARAVASAAYDDRGRPLFPLLALGDEAPRAASTPLTVAERIERRWRARVDVRPDTLDSLAVAVRRCYQDLLETHPALAGTVHLAATGASAHPTPLERCATDSLRSAMTERHVDSAEVTFAPK